MRLNSRGQGVSALGSYWFHDY